MTFVKICGLTRWEDVAAALDAGADALGFVFEPSSPRYVGDRLAEVLEWLGRIPADVFTVAVAGRAECLPEAALPRFSYAQWVEGGAPQGARGTIRTVPANSDPSALPPCDLLLVDSLGAGEWGGTGKVADWDAARRLVEAAEKPVLLAGGLTPDNVADAVRAVRPYGVDVSSGVESEPGRKDPAKVAAFIRAAKGAL
ncbi:MAG: N-(5'-phosphoribosyl)anthranilate isomerase [Fimbriimonadales bacterium]|nr:MAG: N-(5'-phosphoribosyl)anthranilate isomerase [Fimbriimonadales bacterium]